MQNVIVLFNQNIIMCVLMGFGYFMYKKGLITNAGSKELGKILLYAILPCIIMNSFNIEYTSEKLRELLIAFAISTVAMLLSMIVSHLIFKKDEIRDVSAAFSNCGFMGIPLVTAVLGSNAVFYIVPTICYVNILQWTYGLFIMTKDKSVISIKKIFNPAVIGFLLGLVIFFVPVKLPTVLSSVLSTVAATNTFVAMIILGCYLAQTSIASMFTDLRLYAVSAVRLVLIPVLTTLLFKFIPESYHVMKLAILIASVAPVGANVAIFAQMTGKDYTFACKNICLTTILSIATMPLIVMLAENIW